jgi:Spy/CpxP family protein refolding chaperone
MSSLDQAMHHALSELSRLVLAELIDEKLRAQKIKLSNVASRR